MQHLFRSKINIQRMTSASDGMGGQIESWSTVFTNVHCRWNWARGSEREVWGKEGITKDVTVYCAVIAITVLDRVVYNGDTYNILNITNVDEVSKYLILDLVIAE